VSRLPFDAYMTPFPLCELLVKRLGVRGDRVLEPTAGTGNFVRAYKEWHPSADILAVDIQNFPQPHARTSIQTDFLEWGPPQPCFDLVIGNPPYKGAETFVDLSMQWLRPSGSLAFLLRMGFLASVKRYDLLERWKPSHIYTLAGRPSFYGENNDRYDYAFIVWPRTRPALTVWDHVKTPKKRRA